MTHADETSFLPAAAVYMHKGESCGCAEGELVVTPACSERLRGYNLYWGSRAGERLANYTKITELNSPGPEEIRYRFPAALLVPEGAEALLLFPRTLQCGKNAVQRSRLLLRYGNRDRAVFCKGKKAVFLCRNQRPACHGRSGAHTQPSSEKLLFPSASSRSGCDRNYVYGRRHKSRLSGRMGTVFRSLDGSAGAGPSAHAFRCRKPRHAFLQIPRRDSAIGQASRRRRRLF